MTKRKSRNTFRAVKVFLFVFAAFSFFTAGHFFYNFLTHWSKLNVSKIDVRGVKVLNEEYVKHLTGFRMGENIFSYSVNPLIYQREKWIKNIKITRAFPDRIIVNVRERIPIALFRKETQGFVVTFDETIIKNIERAEKIYALPRWDRFNDTSAGTRKRVVDFLRALHSREYEFYEKLVDFKIEGESLVMNMKDYKIYFGHPDKSILKDKFSAVSKIAEDALRKGGTLDYVDLRPFTKKMRSAIIKLKNEVGKKNVK